MIITIPRRRSIDSTRAERGALMTAGDWVGPERVELVAKVEVMEGFFLNKIRSQSKNENFIRKNNLFNY
jgi:hypothetical protein